MNDTSTMSNAGKQRLRLFVRIGTISVIILFLVVMLFFSFYTTSEQEAAIVTTFGKNKAVTESGLHFKIPFIQHVKKVNTTIQGLAIGYDEATNQSIEDESLMITSDFNFVNADFYIEYKVSDPIQYVYASQEPTFILKTLAQSYIRDTIGSYDVDSVITSGKNEIQSVIKEQLIARLEEENIGLQLINITIQDVQPPTETVIEAFKAVETAKQGKETTINNANKYRNEKIPEAEATVDKILQEATSQKESRINEANGQVARFNSMFTEYIKNPTITKQRMFYETMEDILPDLKVIIDNSSESSIQKLLPLESLMTTTTGGANNESN